MRARVDRAWSSTISAASHDARTVSNRSFPSRSRAAAAAIATATSRMDGVSDCEQRASLITVRLAGMTETIVTMDNMAMMVAAEPASWGTRFGGVSDGMGTTIIDRSTPPDKLTLHGD